MNTLQSVFITVINMSITASYVAVGIIPIRLLFRKIPKVFSYALWSAVLIRLILPVSFTSAFSYLNVILPKTKHLTYIPYNIGLMQTPNIDVGINGINNAVNTSLPRAAIAASVNPLQIVIAVSSIVWVLGIAFLILYGVVSYLNVINRIKTATLVKDEIFESDRIATPFVCGFIKPKIYVPTNIAQTELAYILTHERVHIKRLDYLIKPFSFLVLSVHWFNPLMWFSFFLMSKDLEMSCDEKVLDTHGHEIRTEYSNTLLAFATRRSQLFPGSPPLAFGENSTAARIKNVLNYKKPSFWFVAMALTVTVALVVLFTSNPQNTFIGTTSVQLNSLETTEKEDYGYLQVIVRWGEKDNNQPVEGASIKVVETGEESTSDLKGYSSVFHLKTSELDPSTGEKVGYFTILVSKSGAKNSEYLNVPVRSGTTSVSPITLNAYIVSGSGEVKYDELPQEGPTSPQSNLSSRLDQAKEAVPMLADEPQITTNPQIVVTVDLETEKNIQQQVDQGHQPWRLNPIEVTMEFLFSKISQGGKDSSFPIKMDELKIIQMGKSEAIVEVSGDKTPIRIIYLKQLVKQDDTGIWSVVGYNPINSKDVLKE